MDDAFKIELTNQHYLHAPPSEAAFRTLGKLRVVIGGKIVADPSTDLGVEETALSLLRSLSNDHVPGDKVVQQMIFHGCGLILMMGCPIGADFSVRHHGGRVRISHVVRRDETAEASAMPLPEAEVELSIDAYRKAVCEFARKVRAFGGPQSLEFQEEWDRKAYQGFWREFDNLLSEHGGAA